MEDANFEGFFAANLPTGERERLDEVRPRVRQFLRRLPARGVAFVTGGATAAPLERRAVRFVMNFSTGARAAGLAEGLTAEHGWGCILLHHRGAARPFRRVIDALPDEALFAQLRRPNDDGKETATDENDGLAAACEGFTRARDLLLHIPFDTVVEYLYLLREISRELCDDAAFPTRPLLCFAAAAVADYYVPLAQQALHKISGGDGLHLRLENVPKMLHALKTSWLRRQKRSEGSVEGETTPSPDSTGAVRPQPYVVSFKLETDEAEMRVKSVKNLHKYQSDAVVGNLLHNYREKVWIYTHDGDDHHPLCVEKSPGKTIESYLCDFFIAKALEN